MRSLLFALLFVALTNAAFERVKNEILAGSEAPVVAPAPKQQAALKGPKTKSSFERTEELVGYWHRVADSASGTGPIIQISDYNDAAILQISDPAEHFGNGVNVALKAETQGDGIQLTILAKTPIVCKATQVPRTHAHSGKCHSCETEPQIDCGGAAHLWYKIGDIPLAANANNNFPTHSVWSGTSPSSKGDVQKIRLDIVETIGFAIAIVNTTQSYIHHCHHRVIEQRLQNSPDMTAPHWAYLSTNAHDAPLLFTSLGETFTRETQAPDITIPSGGYGCRECDDHDGCPTGQACFGVKFSSQVAGEEGGRCCF